MIETEEDRLAILQVLGEDCTVGTSTIRALFENDYARVAGVYESSNPILSCRSIDIVNVTRGTSVLAGGQTYRVRSIEPDGTGMTVLQLERA